MGEGEGPHPEPLEGPQHAQARPDAVAALHRDEARNLASLVGVNNLWKKDERCYREIGGPTLVTHSGVIVIFVWDRICGDRRGNTNNTDFTVQFN